MLVLVKEIFPLIKKEIKNAKLLIVGRNPTKEIRNLTTKDVFIDDQLEDIREAYHQAGVLVAPIRVGSGTKFKILEAMASGVAVVTTKKGIEGIEANNGEDVLVRESAENLAGAVIELVRNEGLRHKLTINARKLIEEKYNWKKIVQKLEKVYRKTVEKQFN